MRPGMFEIVRTDAGWHARFRAGNHQIVWTTESYTRRRAAVRAVEVIAPLWLESYTPLEVDERGKTPPPPKFNWYANATTSTGTAAHDFDWNPE